MGMKVSLSSRKLAATAILLLSARVAFADRGNPVFQDSGGVAIYDLVAYFTDQKPVKSSEQFTYLDGSHLALRLAAHGDQFATNPAHYTPQYGGYCSYAVSKGHIASTDPEAWRIVEGKLCLNYCKGVQKTWAQDVSGNIPRPSGRIYPAAAHFSSSSVIRAE